MKPFVIIVLTALAAIFLLASAAAIDTLITILRLIHRLP